MAHSNSHNQLVVNNLQFIILDYLGAEISWILDCRRDFGNQSL